MNQSINNIGNFQYGGQPQLVQLPQGQMALVQNPMYPGQQLNPLQMNQLQALQAAQMNGHVGLQGSQHAPQMSAQQQQQQRKTLFTPYLPQATLPALLGDGQLVSGILRVNKKNRSDAYVSTQDGLLDADIFICGSKDRNRALEGDLVAVELLDVDEVWGQKREKEEKKKRKDITDTRTGGSNAGNADRAHRDNSTNGDEQSGTGEGGIRRRGSLRQRPTQKKNDDVEVEGQSLLLVEEEEVNDEQKPLYAGHIVAVIERVAGQMFSGTLGLLRPSSQATKEKQEAERAARDGNSGRHQEQRQQDKPKIVWFKPTDKRVPLIAIPTEQAPRDFVEKHQEYADRIFVACIKRWPITSLHPFGTLVEQLGKMGELKVETDALLRDNNFASDDFSDAVTRSVGLDEWSLEKEDETAIAARRDFRGEKTFTIDPNGANELDDAIHVKTEVDGKIEIGIHIADVAHFIKANSLVDREAKKRGTAVYLMNRKLPPFPLCSFLVFERQSSRESRLGGFAASPICRSTQDSCPPFRWLAFQLSSTCSKHLRLLHLNTQRHREKVPGITKTPKPSNVARQLLQATNISEKILPCCLRLCCWNPTISQQSSRHEAPSRTGTSELLRELVLVTADPFFFGAITNQRFLGSLLIIPIF
jgi:protein SSD1